MFKKCNSGKDQTLDWYDQCEDLKSREILENVLCLFYKGSCASVGLHFKINHFYFTYLTYFIACVTKTSAFFTFSSLQGKNIVLNIIS